MFAFENLKNLVIEKFNVDPDQAQSSFKPPVIKKEFRKSEFKGLISFDVEGDEGIYINQDGKTYKGFLYIPIYNQLAAQSKGWNTLPKFHITKCKTIERQMNRANFNGHYVFANAPVEMEDVDGIVKDLKICGNCRNQLGYIEMDSTFYYENYIINEEIEDNFKEEEIPEEYEVNIWGYTPKWAATSKAYRFKMNFECESCGIHLDGSNGYYLDTHHINGNKTDNEDSNLKCLCVLCHSNTDANHKRNFSTGRSRKRLLDFLDTFSNELEKIQNPYL